MTTDGTIGAAEDDVVETAGVGAKEGAAVITRVERVGRIVKIVGVVRVDRVDENLLLPWSTCRLEVNVH